MRVDKDGHRLSLAREIEDTIIDSLPQLEEGNQELDSWVDTKEFNRLVDRLVEVVQEHMDYAISLLDITG